MCIRDRCTSIQKKFWAYLVDEISSEREKARLVTHVASCAECQFELAKRREALALLLNQDTSIKSQIGEPDIKPKANTKRATRSPLTFAALIALAAVGMGLGWREVGMPKGTFFKFASVNQASSAQNTPAEQSSSSVATEQTVEEEVPAVTLAESVPVVNEPGLKTEAPEDKPLLLARTISPQTTLRIAAKRQVVTRRPVTPRKRIVTHPRPRVRIARQHTPAPRPAVAVYAPNGELVGSSAVEPK